MAEADNATQTLMDYLTQKGVTFDFKRGFLQMIESNQFNRAFHKDLMVLLRRLLRLCDMIKQHNISKEYVRLATFPFFLNKKAWEWLSSLLENTITNWTQCSSTFLLDIGNFTQNGQENLSEAWERFWELLRSCPHHGFSQQRIMHIFYGGVSFHNRTSLDAACQGNLMMKPQTYAIKINEDMCLSLQHLWG
ncbi:hypothetical protein HKD37_01G001858 [Glycine soja]|nr:hypothetical protein GmHk_01G001906 [Glycine max]